MKLNNICCIGRDLLGRTICFTIALKCPEVRVIVLDDEKTISEWNSNSPAFYGPDLDQMIKKCRHRNLHFSSFYESAIKEADLIFLSVKVPIKKLMGRKRVAIDFKELEDAIKLVALYSESDKILVEKSDVPVKAFEKITSILNSTSKSGFRFHILSIPCYITENSSVEEILYPDRIVIGCQCNPSSRAAAQSLCELYEYWIPKTSILILSQWSAGLYKLVTNSFLAQKECSLNSLLAICEETEADFSTVLNILGRDSKIGPKYLSSSVELDTLQEDVLNLIFMCELLTLNETAEYWQALLDLNEYCLRRYFDRIKSVLRSVEGEDITVWGFKETGLIEKKLPALKLCKWLLKENSNLRIHDPELQANQILKELEIENVELKERNVQIYNDIYLSIHNSSALILAIKKEEFIHLDFSQIRKWMKRPLVIDTYKLFDKEVMDKFGFEYFTLSLKREQGQNIAPQF